MSMLLKALKGKKGLVAKKVSMTRAGKTFQTTVYIRAGKKKKKAGDVAADVRTARNTLTSYIKKHGSVDVEASTFQAGGASDTAREAITQLRKEGIITRTSKGAYILSKKEKVESTETIDKQIAELEKKKKGLEKQKAKTAAQKEHDEISEGKTQKDFVNAMKSGDMLEEVLIEAMWEGTESLGKEAGKAFDKIAEKASSNIVEDSHLYTETYSDAIDEGMSKKDAADAAYERAMDDNGINEAYQEAVMEDMLTGVKSGKIKLGMKEMDKMKSTAMKRLKEED